MEATTALSDFFGGASGVSALVGFVLYLIFLFRLSKQKENVDSKQKPNAISWLMWSLIDFFNFGIYTILVGGNLAEMVFLFMNLIETTTVVFILFHYGWIKKPDTFEIIIFFLFIALLLYYVGSHFALRDKINTDENNVPFMLGPKCLNITLQFIYLLGFVVIIKGVLKNKNFENSKFSILSWSLTSFGGLLSVLSIFFNDYENWVAFISPAVFCVGDGVLAILFFLERRKHLKLITNT